MSNKPTQSFHHAKPIFCSWIVEKNTITGTHSIIFRFKFNAKEFFNYYKIVLSEFGKAFFKPSMRRAIGSKLFVFHKPDLSIIFDKNIRY